jgi:hypothetical protein
MASTRQLMQTQYPGGKYFKLLDNKGKNDSPEIAREKQKPPKHTMISIIFL